MYIKFLTLFLLAFLVQCKNKENDRSEISRNSTFKVEKNSVVEDSIYYKKVVRKTRTNNDRSDIILTELGVGHKTLYNIAIFDGVDTIYSVVVYDTFSADDLFKTIAINGLGD